MPYHYDRLSPQDNGFLLMESPGVPMHVASTQIFDAGPLKKPEGGIDYARIMRFTESVLHRIPRYRQRLKWIPFENVPVWIDDPHFEIDYHIRHTALPHPGSVDQLKRLSSRIMEQPLDRQRPLWEIWVVEGLEEGGRFALISKIHHCMIDGSSGVDIGQILQSITPDRHIGEPARYIPRPEPTSAELMRDSFGQRLGMPLRALRGLRSFARETNDLRDEITVRAKAIAKLYGSQMGGVSETPINGPLSPHRRFDWLQIPLSDMKAVRRALACTINDVVLTTVTGAFREYLLGRQVDPEGLDFRIQAPVSMRGESERGKLGNRISTWVIPLPLAEPDPMKRLEVLRARTQELKESRQALGVEMMMSVMGEMPTGLLSLGMQAAGGTMNSIVTNVPGPQFPLYLQGAEMLAMYPQVPLLENVGLGVALISYNGQVCWGFNADADKVPDLPLFVASIRRSFEELARSAAVELGEGADTSTAEM